MRRIDKLEGLLRGTEFLRVHLRFLVNLSRARAICTAGTGASSCWSMEITTRKAVPVSRRSVPAVRRALGFPTDPRLRDPRTLHRAIDELVGLRRLAGRDDAVVMR